ncbi:hypothetical protein [Yersinia sp. 2105 StPb PI]|uniref:hypothetical protein n=1 Tax=Yersinia sp. 2105 StPb PI TaxID=2507058 RepID=UPI000FFC4161|nr:hypothetical protein [Yersinia sp. 2105 StPb PI]RXA97246.1 hypothetical protein EQP49_05935 [Yersinia sp. 2105 StPb PI]
MITKNFRLNALANQYSAAIYDHVKQQNGGDFFTIDAGEFPLRIEIVGGVSGVRGLVDAYYLEALKLNYSQWEKVAIELLTKCIDGNNLTQDGREIWQSMGSDMGSTVAGGAQ